MSTSNRDDEHGDLTLAQVFASVLAAFFGVQKDSVRRRDLSRGRPGQFIVVGLVLTAAFILALVGIVTLVLRLAGV